MGEDNLQDVVNLTSHAITICNAISGQPEFEIPPSGQVVHLIEEPVAGVPYATYCQHTIPVVMVSGYGKPQNLPQNRKTNIIVSQPVALYFETNPTEWEGRVFAPNMGFHYVCRDEQGNIVGVLALSQYL